MLTVIKWEKEMANEFSKVGEGLLKNVYDASDIKPEDARRAAMRKKLKKLKQTNKDLAKNITKEK